MATYDIDKFSYSNNIYRLNDIQISAGHITNSLTVDDLTAGDLVVTGNASFTNNLQVNTINGSASVSSSTTGITASTTATKTTLGTAFTIPNVTAAGSASTWVFEEISIPNVTAAGSASSWTFEEKTIPNVTAVGSGSFTSGSFSGGSGSFTQGSFSGGSGSFSASVTDHVLSFSHTHTAATHGADSHTHTPATHGADSHTHTAPTLGTAIKVQSKSGGSNGSAPTLGTAIKVQSKKSGANGSAPTLGTAFTVPNVTGNTSATVAITDNGHAHTI